MYFKSYCFLYVIIMVYQYIIYNSFYNFFNLLCFLLVILNGEYFYKIVCFI